MSRTERFGLRNRRWVRRLLVGFAGLWILANVVSAWFIARPIGLAQGPHPATLGVDHREVAIGDDLRGWHLPAPGSSSGTVVIVHGLGGSWSEWSTLAARLQSEGYDALLIELGYMRGASLLPAPSRQPFSGGTTEADEVRAGVDWAHANATAPVYLIGMSYGALASVLAAERGAPVAGVVADSGPIGGGFDDTAITRIGFPLVRPLVWVFNAGDGVADLREEIDRSTPFPVPVLVIHNTGDAIVRYRNGPKMAELTDGVLETFTASCHICPDQRGDDYTERLLGFLRKPR